MEKVLQKQRGRIQWKEEKIEPTFRETRWKKARSYKRVKSKLWKNHNELC